LIIVHTSKFRKDYKRAKKQQKNLDLLKDVISKLANKEQLGLQYRDHQLSGSLEKYRELHIQPNWLLIYRLNETEDKLILVRLGSHPELFK